MKLTSELIPDTDIERVHGHANFGGQNKRDVVDEGVLKYAFGYSGGHTQLTILLEHGLLMAPKPGKYNTTLSKKGREYLRAIKGDIPIATMLAFFRERQLT